MERAAVGQWLGHEGQQDGGCDLTGAAAKEVRKPERHGTDQCRAQSLSARLAVIGPRGHETTARAPAQQGHSKQQADAKAG